MRVVLDVNVLISAVLVPRGPSGRILAAWHAGAFELVISQALLAELGRAFGYPRLRKRITPAESDALLAFLRRTASLVEDVTEPPRRVADELDDYLIALAETARAVLVSGDKGLLALSGAFPIKSPREFLAELEA